MRPAKHEDSLVGSSTKLCMHYHVSLSGSCMQCWAITLKKYNTLLITCYSHCDEIHYIYILCIYLILGSILYYILLIVQNNSLGNNITSLCINITVTC